MARAAASRALTLIATVVRVVAAVIAAVILLWAVFVFFEANPANPLVAFAGDVRSSLGWFTVDLFRPSDPKLGETINSAIAALVYVVVGSLISKLIVRLAPAVKTPAR